MSRKQLALLEPTLVRQALLDAVKKLSPMVQWRNPVMFIVWVGSLLTTLLAIAMAGGALTGSATFTAAVSIWLWFTVLFANFAEAMAEGRSKAQANSLKGVKKTAFARKLRAPQHDAPVDHVPAEDLRKGDVVLVEAGDIIPCDGEVIEGGASVDESAITGESAPVIRESGGDFASVTGGTRILSDWLVIRCSVNPGETFLDRMIAMVEGAQRRKTPNEIALTILLIALTLVFLLAHRHHLALLGVERQCGQRYRTGRPAGVPDPDHHRRAAIGHRRRRDEPYARRQRDRHQRPRGGSRWRRRCPAAG